MVAALAKEAVGKSRLLALILPVNSQHQDAADARLFARKFGIKTRTVELSKVYHGLLGVLPAANKITLANLKPRLRMLALYYFANKLNYLVCGTGNKSELSVGYFTKHGDGAADLLPIGSLYKKEVRALARILKIPQEIIDKVPTAGLWVGQTDEGELGVSYEELDEILKRRESKLRQCSAQNKVLKVETMIDKSKHKRTVPQICYI